MSDPSNDSNQSRFRIFDFALLATSAILFLIPLSGFLTTKKVRGYSGDYDRELALLAISGLYVLLLWGAVISNAVLRPSRRYQSRQHRRLRHLWLNRIFVGSLAIQAIALLIPFSSVALMPLTVVGMTAVLLYTTDRIQI